MKPLISLQLWSVQDACQENFEEVLTKVKEYGYDGVEFAGYYGCSAEEIKKTLAELYDPDKMPADLRTAHKDLDGVVGLCYRQRIFESDEERLEYLFKLYEIMTITQKELI